MISVPEKEIKMRLSADVILACEDLDISFVGWFIHFGNVNPYYADCKMCSDYPLGVCPASVNPACNPIECFKGEKFDITNLGDP